jgi:hypothetical protein
MLLPLLIVLDGKRAVALRVQLKATSDGLGIVVVGSAPHSALSMDCEM